MRGDYDAAARLFREVMRSDDVKESSRATAQLANLEADRGNWTRPRQILRDGILKDRQPGEEGFASQKTIGSGFSGGNRRKPRTRCCARSRSRFDEKRSPWVIVQAVSILARYGSPEEATRLMNSFPAGEGPKYDADRLRMKGEILAAKGNFKQARRSS